MAEKSGLWTLKMQDLVRGLVTAVFAAVFTWLYGIVSMPDFQIGMLLSVDWGEVIQISLTTGMAYLAKNFFTDSEGKVFGSI